MTTTPDLSEDFPYLSFFISVNADCGADDCTNSGCAAAREAQRALAELAGLRQDVANLLTWKAEASAVLERWEEVWHAAGEPGPLGRFKSDNVKEVLQQLQDALRQAKRDLKYPPL